MTLRSLFALIVPFLAAVSLCSCDRHDAPDHTAVIDGLRSANRLSLSSMSVGKTAVIDTTAWYTVGKRIAAYSYNSYITAYIDLSQLSPADFVFDDDARTVSITLPPIQTEISGRDMTMRKEYENIGLFRSDIDARERAAIKELANVSFRREISDNPEFIFRLKASAENKARSYFQSIFENEGYTATVTFR